MEFPWTFPVSFVFFTRNGELVEPIVIVSEEGGVHGIAVFTEDLFAERCIAELGSPATQVYINSHDELLARLRRFTNTKNIRHVAIDPTPRDRSPATWIEFW